jgi:hypothetical protein
MQIARFDRKDLLNSRHFVIVFLLNEEKFPFIPKKLPQELLELVLLRWLNPVVVVGGVPPRMNCTLGGESWHISGTLVNGGAEILRVAVRCRAAAGDLGLASGLTRACLRTPPGLCSGTNPAGLSSGRGPRVEPPEAELIPDMAETESPDRLLERTKLA